MIITKEAELEFDTNDFNFDEIKGLVENLSKWHKNKHKKTHNHNKATRERIPQRTKSCRQIREWT